MVVRGHPALNLSQQCRLLSIGRSSLYYEPKGEREETPALMRRIDELFLKYPLLTDYRLFSVFLYEAKPLKLLRAAFDNLPRFRSLSG